jgi:hypothetical protein
MAVREMGLTRGTQAVKKLKTDLEIQHSEAIRKLPVKNDGKVYKKNLKKKATE